MQKENNLTAGQWCDHWFTANRHKWNSNTEGGYARPHSGQMCGCSFMLLLLPAKLIRPVAG